MRTFAFLALGIALQMTSAQAVHAQTRVNLYTWFSATHGDHMTTSDPRWAGTLGEVRRVGGGSGYVLVRQEGQVFSPYEPKPPNTVPLYSFWNAARADNFLTSDPRWTPFASTNGYTRLRLEGYVYPSYQPGTVPLRSFWSPSRADNYASTDPRLAVALSGDAGERTMSVEGGRYTHFRIEGYMTPPPAPAPAARGAMTGLVDMHTHLMAHLGFGKKLIHGVPDAFPDGTFGPPNGMPDGSIVPAGTRDCNPADTRAATIADALGHDNSTHGGHDFFSNTCGDHQRNFVIRLLEGENGAHSEHGSDKTGWPSFEHWPRFNDITHQQMWVDWIRRAHARGLRVMVTLAVNNQTVARLIKGDPPLDDRASADLQIRETIGFVRRHSDFMEVAFSAGDLRRIVRSGKLAVVLGVELDDLGNFQSRPIDTITRAAIAAEVARLRSNGVRYVFPVHLTDNRFAGTAIDQAVFNVMNRLQTGAWWDIECSASVGRRVATSDAMLWIAGTVSGIGSPPEAPPCGAGEGHRNRRGLTSAGRDLLDILMRHGMLIDIDHMSERSTDEAIALARNFPSGWGYPVVSGHNGPRGPGGSERSARADQLESIRDLGGLLGLGWEGSTAEAFHTNLRLAHQLMGPGRVAFGTDTNGFSKLPGPPLAPRAAALWSTGSRAWNYTTDGVAQYGMLPEFVQDLRLIERSTSLPTDRADVNAILGAAESFARTWERAELAGRSALAP